MQSSLSLAFGLVLPFERVITNRVVLIVSGDQNKKCVPIYIFFLILFVSAIPLIRNLRKIWRVPYKIYPVKSTQNFFRRAPWKKWGVIPINQKKIMRALWKNLGRFCRVDFTRLILQGGLYTVDFKGYLSNHFSACRLNGWLCNFEVFLRHCPYKFEFKRHDISQLSTKYVTSLLVSKELQLF